MEKVIILYTQFLDYNGEKDKIGGIETYIRNLLEVCKEAKKEVNIIQFSNVEFEKKYDSNVNIYGIKDEKKKKSQKLLDKAYQIGDLEKDILIFASSHMNRKNKFEKSIAIQHGIYWDVDTVKGKKWSKFATTILKSLQIFLEIKRNKCVNKVVCVDYNYINWYRALTLITNERLYCIPNFTAIPFEYKTKENNVVKIIFARRFERIRGVQNICNVVERLSNENRIFEFTFAGSGSFEQELKEKFKDNKKVKFITYKAEDSIKIHQEYDIAVVPSIGSEGTSLSLLEAMSASCCVLATNVGGMSNILIDGFNGVVCDTDEESLYKNIIKLMDNPELRKELSRNGYNCVEKSFKLSDWKNKWRIILDE